MENLLVGALCIVVGVFLRSFLPSYMNEKGKNLATHEDIEKLANQQAILTETAKTIEAKISDKVWDRQKQWEMKRDALFDVVRALGDLDEAIMSLSIDLKLLEQTSDKTNHEKSQAQRVRNDKAIQKWREASLRLERAKSIADLVGGMECSRALSAAVKLMRDITCEVLKGNPQTYSSSARELAWKKGELLQIVRNELGITDTVEITSTD